MVNRQIVHLVPSEGRSLSPRVFVDQYAGLILNGGERRFLEGAVQLLENENAIPLQLRTPWRVDEGPAGSRERCIVARKSGARSALWQEQQIKLKGCRSLAGSSGFPFEWLPFGATEIESVRIPFGVMTAEAVLRELLGFCFCQKHGIPCATTPICVYAYPAENGPAPFCMVLREHRGRRAESFLRLKGIAVSAIVHPMQQDGTVLKGSEAPLEGLNSRWYAEKKSRWLAELHFRGGFRGLLNSNIGNDVIVEEKDETPRFLFCDFDSFQVIQLPNSPSGDFLAAFALQCVMEVVKGSVPILDFIHVPARCNTAQAARMVGAAYRLKSSLWNAYVNRARLKAHELSWDWDSLEEAFDQAFETPAFLEASCSVILSEYALQRHKRADRWDYVPHEVD